MGTISLGLDFLWEFLKPILSDTVKERLKPKDSSTKAKERLFKLYEVLGNVRDKTDDFLEKLRAYVNDVESGELAVSMEEFKRSLHESEACSRGEIIPPPDNSSTSLQKAASTLMNELEELKQALDRVNPQLRIYNREIVQDSNEYISARLQVYKDLDRSLQMPTDLQLLRPLLSRAEKNRILINDAIEKTRGFIKTEFSFKESF